MNKIIKGSTEVKLNGLVSSRQSNYNKLNHENFSSLLNQENKENLSEIKEDKIQKKNITPQEVILQNTAYLNKIFLNLVA